MMRIQKTMSQSTVENISVAKAPETLNTKGPIPRSIIAKLKSIKHIEIYLAVAVIAVMVFIFFTSFGGGNNNNNTTRLPSSGGQSQTVYADEFEKRLAQTLSTIQGAGVVDVMVTERGILVIATGADNPVVRMRLFQAVQTVVGSTTKNIEIIARK